MSVTLIRMRIDVHIYRNSQGTRYMYGGESHVRTTLKPTSSTGLSHFMHMCLFYILELCEALPANTYTSKMCISVIILLLV